MNIRQATDRDQKRTAERHPDMVREIASQGHDIGCHSYMHKKVYELTPEEFRADFKYNHPERKLIEYPLSTSKVFGYNVPVAGGGYFPLFPYWLTKRLLRKINSIEKQPFMFYLHPWELDPDQPRIQNSKIQSKFRHYNNLSKTEKRLERLLDDFKFGVVIGKEA